MGSRAAFIPSAEHRCRVQSTLKVAFVLALISLTLLDRFGLRVSAAYAIHPALIAMYGLVVVMLLTGSARVDPWLGLLYVFVVTITGLSFILNSSLAPRQYASISSLMLVVVIYAPLAISIRPEIATAELWHWLIKAYIGFAVALGVIGIVQFYAQYVFTAPWLFDYRPLLPEAIRGSGVYNTINYAGTWETVKSNGFFLREASGFSFLMAFAMIVEWSFARRKWVLAVLAFALVVSYSGSGLLAIAVALLFPLGFGSVLRIAAAGLAGAVILLLFGDALNLHYTVARVGEFQVDNPAKSSAYCRFISPGKVAMDNMVSEPWTAYLGHGPGTMQKLHDTCETTYGKMLFEYGLLGTLAFTSLMIAALNRSMAPVRVRVALWVSWMLLGGHLVAPEPILIALLLSAMWPKDLLSAAAAGAGGHRNE